MKNHPELATGIDTLYSKYVVRVKPESKSVYYERGYFAKWVAANSGSLVLQGSRFTTTLTHDTVRNGIVINTKFNGIDTTLKVVTRIVKPPNTFVKSYYKLLSRTRFTTGLLIGAFCIVSLLLALAIGAFYLASGPATATVASRGISTSTGLLARLVSQLMQRRTTPPQPPKEPLV